MVDVVFAMDNTAAPLQWPLPRVSHVYSGPDNSVRVVELGTSFGELVPLVHKLQKLPLSGLSSEK